MREENKGQKEKKNSVQFSRSVVSDSLRVCWTVRRSNQSILKDISPECSLEGLRLKLKL